MDTLQAAILLAKLDIFNDEIELRNQVAQKYIKNLAPYNQIKLPKISQMNTSVWAQFTLLSKDRDSLRKALSLESVPTAAYYSIPLHLQPVFDFLGHNPGDFPVTEQISKSSFSLPMSPYLTETEVSKIVSCMAEASRSRGRGLDGFQIPTRPFACGMRPTP